MWTLMGLCLILLGICTYTDVKNREIFFSLPLLFVLLAILYRGTRGIFWQGGIELVLRLVPGAALLGIRILKKEWIGSGDGLLVLVCGYMLGARDILRMTMIATLLSGMYAIFLLVKRKCKRKDTIPFVPFLLAGSVGVGIFWIVEGVVPV